VGFPLFLALEGQMQQIHTKTRVVTLTDRPVDGFTEFFVTVAMLDGSASCERSLGCDVEQVNRDFRTIVRLAWAADGVFPDPEESARIDDDCYWADPPRSSVGGAIYAWRQRQRAAL
jgi:hypothetical protein